LHLFALTEKYIKILPLTPTTQKIYEYTPFFRLLEGGATKMLFYKIPFEIKHNHYNRLRPGLNIATPFGIDSPDKIKMPDNIIEKPGDIDFGTENATSTDIIIDMDIPEDTNNATSTDIIDLDILENKNSTSTNSVVMEDILNRLKENMSQEEFEKLDLSELYEFDLGNIDFGSINLESIDFLKLNQLVSEWDSEKDSDEDGLTDLEEALIWKTDINNSDTDGDGYLDGQEVKGGYNPNGVGKLE